MPATPDEPAYYRTELDINVLNDLDNFNREEAVHCITTRPVDPLGEDASESWEIRAARATPEELAEWGKAYDTLKQRADTGARMLAIARAKWEADRAAALAELRAAYNDYEHVHDAIARRHEEVEELREKANAERQAAEQARLDAAQAAEDAELGPRTWVVHEPTVLDANYYGKKKTSDMFIPTIHVAGCPVTKGREDMEGERAWQYARAGGVEAAIQAGGPLASNGRPVKGSRAPVKMCGRCKPEASLRTAGLGHVFDAWQAEVDAIQPPMHAERYIPQKLGLEDEWHHWRGRSGYTLVDPDTYRQSGCIEEHEIMLGWWDKGRGRVVTQVPAPEKLERLLKILPERGYAVRRFNEPEKYGGKECQSAVAVRRMTPGEIRQRQADSDATARWGNQS